jgi:hypothetical protein
MPEDERLEPMAAAAAGELEKWHMRVSAPPYRGCTPQASGYTPGSDRGQTGVRPGSDHLRGASIRPEPSGQTGVRPGSDHLRGASIRPEWMTVCDYVCARELLH